MYTPACLCREGGTGGRGQGQTGRDQPRSCDPPNNCPARQVRLLKKMT